MEEKMTEMRNQQTANFDIEKFQFIDNYITSNGNHAFAQGKVPFHVTLLNWQLSNQGDYIEYVVEVEYKEG